MVLTLVDKTAFRSLSSLFGLARESLLAIGHDVNTVVNVGESSPSIVPRDRLCVWFLVSLQHSMTWAIQATSRSNQSDVHLARSQQTLALSKQLLSLYNVFRTDLDDFSPTLCLAGDTCANLIDCAPVLQERRSRGHELLLTKFAACQRTKQVWLCQLHLLLTGNPIAACISDSVHAAVLSSNHVASTQLEVSARDVEDSDVQLVFWL